MSKKNGKKETAAQVAEAPVAAEVQELTSEQEIQALRQAHKFFAEYSAVPGFLATQWGQALDTIAFVANSLISKSGLLEKKTNKATPTATPTTANGADTTAPQA